MYVHEGYGEGFTEEFLSTSSVDGNNANDAPISEIVPSGALSSH